MEQFPVVKVGEHGGRGVRKADELSLHLVHIIWGGVYNMLDVLASHVLLLLLSPNFMK